MAFSIKNNGSFSVNSSGSISILGSGSGSGLRPLIDANHIHVWNCDDSSGATVLVDSVGGKNLTLQGSAGTTYALNQSAGDSPYPWVQSLGGSNPIASASGMNLSLTNTTFEFVVRFTALPSGNDQYSLSRLETTSAPFNYYYTSFGNNVKIYGGVYFNGPYPSGYYTTTTPFYNSPDINIETNTTYYVMWTYAAASGDQNIYINGVLKNTRPAGHDTGAINFDLYSLGGVSGSANTLLGYIRDVRISNIVRDGTYAAAAYAALV